MRRRITGIAAALIAASLIGGTAAAAASPNSESTIHFTEVIDETLPAGTCPDLPADLSIHLTGTLTGHFHLSVDANGVVHVNAPDTIQGTAVDSDGGTYRFNYHNVLTVTDAGFPILVTTTDHFNLVGNGAANQLHTSFVRKLLITEDSVEVVFLNARGDPDHCDAL
jgi:hypothetical protein